MFGILSGWMTAKTKATAVALLVGAAPLATVGSCSVRPDGSIDFGFDRYGSGCSGSCTGVDVWVDGGYYYDDYYYDDYYVVDDYWWWW